MWVYHYYGHVHEFSKTIEIEGILEFTKPCLNSNDLNHIKKQIVESIKNDGIIVCQPKVTLKSLTLLNRGE